MYIHHVNVSSNVLLGKLLRNCSSSWRWKPASSNLLTGSISNDWIESSKETKESSSTTNSQYSEVPLSSSMSSENDGNFLSLVNWSKSLSMEWDTADLKLRGVVTWDCDSARAGSTIYERARALAKEEAVVATDLCFLFPFSMPSSSNSSLHLHPYDFRLLHDCEHLDSSYLKNC